MNLLHSCKSVNILQFSYLKVSLFSLLNTTTFNISYNNQQVSSVRALIGICSMSAADRMLQAWFQLFTICCLSGCLAFDNMINLSHQPRNKPRLHVLSISVFQLNRMRTMAFLEIYRIFYHFLRHQ